MHQLDPSVKIIWAAAYFIRSSILIFSLFVVEYLFVRTGKLEWLLPFGWTTIILAIICLAYIIIYPQLKYKFWKFEVRPEELYLERGVLTRVKTTAPFRRVQHLDVAQNVIERMMDLGKLVIYTAGTRGADVIIPGLPIAYAEMLRDQLKNYSREDAV